jgi:hypothetical protein
MLKGKGTLPNSLMNTSLLGIIPGSVKLVQNNDNAVIMNNRPLNRHK